MSRLILPRSYRRRQGGFILPGLFGGKKGSGGGGGVDPNRTYVYLATGVSNTSATILSWPAPTNDGLGAWNAGNPTRLTIPSSGNYLAYACVVVAESGGANNGTGLEIMIDGSGVAVGCGRQIFSSGSSTLTGKMAETPVLALTAGQYLECRMRNPNNAGADVVANDTMPTMMMLYKLPSFAGAVAYFTSDNTAVNSNNTPSWDAELSDTGSFWNAGSPTVMTMGATGYANVLANISAADVLSSSSFGVEIQKNGAAYISEGALFAGNSGTFLSRCANSGPVPVVSTNTVAVRTLSNDTSYTQQAAGSSFGVEFHTDKCAGVTLSASVTGVDADTSPPYYVAWTSETFDDDNFFDSGSNTRLTCSAAGVYQVGATVNISAVNSVPTFVFIERYNSSNTLIDRFGQAADGRGVGSAVTGLGAWTPHLSCAAGDYFRVAVEVAGDTSVTIDSTSKFWLRRFA